LIVLQQQFLPVAEQEIPTVTMIEESIQWDAPHLDLIFFLSKNSRGKSPGVSGKIK
jgi:hypothetical protein